MKEVIGLFVTLSLWFIVLLVLTHFIYYRYFRFIPLTNLSSAFLMGFGLFLLICLPQFSLPHFVLQISTFELAILWIYLIMGVAHAAIEKTVPTELPVNRLAMGASVTATAILALLLDKAEPLLHGSILFLSLVAILWLLVYLLVMGQWIIKFINNHAKIYASQLILLASIAVQMCVLMEVELFHKAIPVWIYQSEIFLGYVFYIFGFTAIVRYLLFTRFKRILISLSGISSLMYSAMAITGLAMLMNGYPSWMLAIVWWWTVGMFILIEGLELNRLMIAIRLKGLKKAIFNYHPFQWLRIFSFITLFEFANLYLHDKLEIILYFLTILCMYECIIMVFCLIKKNSSLGINTLQQSFPK